MSNFLEVFSRVSELNKRTEQILSFSKLMGNRLSFELEHNDEVFLLAELQIAVDALLDADSVGI